MKADVLYRKIKGTLDEAESPFILAVAGEDRDFVIVETRPTGELFSLLGGLLDAIEGTMVEAGMDPSEFAMRLVQSFADARRLRNLGAEEAIAREFGQRGTNN